MTKTKRFYKLKDMENKYQIIETIRLKRGITQTVAAAELEMTHATYNNIIQGHTNPSALNQKRIERWIRYHSKSELVNQ